MDDEELFTELQSRIDIAVRDFCARHYNEPTQEHQFSSRLAQKLEDEIGLIVGDGKAITVTAHDIPDKGRGAAERYIGADLYISVIRRDLDPPVRKGFLIQSKWDNTLRTDSSLRSQSNNMYRRSRTGSFVWSYGADGVDCIRANRTRHETLPHDLMDGTMTPGQLIADGLRCTEGDLSIGMPGEGPGAFREMLKRMLEPSGLEVTVVPIEHTN